MLEMLFSAKGRINRAPFWGYNILVSIVFLGIQFLAGMIDSSIGMLVTLLVIPVIWINFVLYIKRLHDLDKSGWMSLLLFVPFANLYIIIICGFFRGTIGKNQFGEDPLGGVSPASEVKEL